MLKEAIDVYSSQGVAVNGSSKLHRATKVIRNAAQGEVEAALFVAANKLAYEHLSVARMIDRAVARLTTSGITCLMLFREA